MATEVRMCRSFDPNVHGGLHEQTIQKASCPFLVGQ